MLEMDKNWMIFYLKKKVDICKPRIPGEGMFCPSLTNPAVGIYSERFKNGISLQWQCSFWIIGLEFGIITNDWLLNVLLPVLSAKLKVSLIFQLWKFNKLQIINDTKIPFEVKPKNTVIII